MAGTPFHQNVSLKGIHYEDFSLTVKLSGNPTQADVGKTVTQDKTAASTFKLAGDGDPIMGRLASVEYRQSGNVVGAVEFLFTNTVPIATGQTVAIGDSVVGGGAGTVKKTATADTRTFVTEIIGTDAVVVKF